MLSKKKKKKRSLVNILWIFASNFTVLRILPSLDKHFEIWNDVNQKEFVEIYVSLSQKALGRVVMHRHNLIKKTQHVTGETFSSCIKSFEERRTHAAVISCF